MLVAGPGPASNPNKHRSRHARQPEFGYRNLRKESSEVVGRSVHYLAYSGIFFHRTCPDAWADVSRGLTAQPRIVRIAGKSSGRR